MAARCGCSVRVGQGGGGELPDAVDGVGNGAGGDAKFSRSGTFGTTKIRTSGLVGKKTWIFVQNDNHIT
jgi:hypothetical protein